ncbi:MAG: flagellar basal body rod protein FlgC [Verrucomicrobia bacterium]|nr:flagellar basal body rod protein FlgC [Verrucomicrobiota bacterium]
MKLMPGLDSSVSALQAERVRLEVISQNIANANATKSAGGQPYQRQVVRFETLLQEKLGQDSEAVPQAVKVARIIKDSRPPNEVYQPGHPDADPSTHLVRYPNVNIHEEMADMIASSRAYEANLAVVKNARTMTLQTLAIGRR